MEKLMSLVGVRLAEVISIELLNLRIVMRLTVSLSFVLGIESVSTSCEVGVDDVYFLIYEQ